LVRALNDPLLKPIRQIVPLLGGLDISPMILFLLLQVASKALMYVSGSFGSLLI
jgi:YggT family protein